jgi:regulator of nucleoside diphosphate kinase
MSTATVRPVDIRRPDIRVTRRDVAEIERLLARNPGASAWRAVNFLTRELARATIIQDDAIPPNVAGLGSLVEYREDGKDKSRMAVLSLPGDRMIPRNAVSILSPIGTALLGLSAGQSICFAGPDGYPVTVTVIDVKADAAPDRRRRRAGCA